MPFLLVPNEVRATEAFLWIGIINEPDDPGILELFTNGAATGIPANWGSYTTASGSNSIRYQLFVVAGLQPRTGHVFELFRAGDLLATCSARTLPLDLPFRDEQPFTVLLSSCFCSSRPESAAIGSTYLRLRMQDKPDIKVLAGDQVYLDDPALHFTFNTHSRKVLEDTLFINYARTWTQTGFATGNNAFLTDGANFFTSDDHEFWNNAPDAATLILDTFTQQGRDEWWEIASNLYRIFQTSKSATTFDVGPLSFFLADTRVNRGPGREDFMSAGDRNALEAWVNGLRGVGVLVVGQPIFASKAGFFASRFADKHLPNYKQYEDLARILSRTRRSIIVLTGDVHYGRIASCQLGANIFLHEVISSPSALVNPAVGGKWDPAPGTFPDFGVPGVLNRSISTDSSYQLSNNHFLTLAFFRDGAEISVRIRSIEIKGDGQAPMPKEIAKLDFLLGA
jgi:hypothetical protein